MRYTLYLKGLDKSSAIESYLDKRIKHLGKVVKNDSAYATVELAKTSNHHKSGDLFRAEVKVHSSGKEFYASAEREDLYTAIDEVKDQITSELTKYKNKSETVFLRGARAVKGIIKGFDPRDYENWRATKAWKKWRKNKD
jgi:ribosomal subunit interface protein